MSKSNLKLVEPENTPAAPEPPTMAELRAAIADRVDPLFDELDTIHYKIPFASGDALLPLYETEARIQREIDREPGRYGTARGQWLLAQAIEAESNVTALRAQAAAHSARADEFTKAAQKINDPDLRDCEMAKVSVSQRKAQEALAKAEAEQRNNLLTETKQAHERRIAELDAQLAKLRTDLEWQRKHMMDRMESAGMSGVGADFAEKTQAAIEALEAQVSEAEAALRAQEGRAVSIMDPNTWPDSVKNEVHQAANSCRERIQRRAAKVRGKF